MPKQIRVDVVSPFHPETVHSSKSKAQSFMPVCVFLNLASSNGNILSLFVWSWQQRVGVGRTVSVINLKHYKS